MSSQSPEALGGQSNYYPESSPIPTQLALTQLEFHLFALKTFDTTAQNYSRRIAWKTGKEWQNDNGIYQRTKIALADLYFAQVEENSSARQLFRIHWGEEAGRIESLLFPLFPKLAQEKAKGESKAGSINPVDQWKIIINTATQLPSLSKDQQTRVFQLIGYDKDQAFDIAKKIGISAAAGTAAGIAGFSLVGSAVFVSMHMESIMQFTPETIYRALLISYLAHYGTLIGVSLQNIRLLQHAKIGTSPDCLATCLYYLLKKTAPNTKFLRNGAIPVSAMLQVGWQEAGLLPTLTTPEGQIAVLARNVTGTAFNLLLAAAEELWLKTHGTKHG